MKTPSAFDAERSKAYDSRVSQMILGYDVMQRLTEVCLSAELQPDAHILMAGAGTGAEVVACGTRHPGWKITAVEPSQDMSAIGLEKTRAAGLEDRVAWHRGPLDTLHVDDTFDAATLLLVLHFLPNNGEKLELLTGLSEVLAPGGPLILSTFVGDPETTRTKKLYDLARAWAIAEGIEPQEAAEKLNLTRKDVYLVAEERIKSLLRDAGFIDVQRILQGLAMTTWIARTPR